MAFVSVTNTSRNCSLYLGAHDLRARSKQWQFENVKGTEGDDVAVSLVHHPFIQPGDAWRGSPWILSFCEGDWVNAGEIYHGWFEKAFGIRPLEHDWIRRENCFQIVMMMLPEGNINFRFRDVPDLARAMPILKNPVSPARSPLLRMQLSNDDLQYLCIGGRIVACPGILRQDRPRSCAAHYG